MTLLQFFFTISGIIISIIAIDIARKQKFNALHFLVFIGVGGGLLTFSVFPNVLDNIGNIFGVARGADVLVYTSIIFLFYFVLLLLTKHVENKEGISELVRELAINNSSKNKIEGKEVFLIRAYNEGRVIKGVIQEILDKGYKNILVVNDGSKDKTLEILNEFLDKITILTHFKNRGGGAALETGLEYLRRYSKAKYIVTFDADGQHNIDDLPRFFDEFEKHKKLGVVLGSRFIKKTQTNTPFIRKIVLNLGRLFTFFISGIYLTDAHNGYRVFTLKSIKKIRLTIDGMAYASELIEEIKKHQIKYKEVPVNIRYTEYSMNKGQGSGNAINIAMRIIWTKFFK